jgi:hypothetical protein
MRCRFVFVILRGIGRAAQEGARPCPTLRYGLLLKSFFALERSIAPTLNARCWDDAAGLWNWQAKNLFLT